MKMFLFLFGIMALFMACSDDSSSANNEKQYPLQLNENCDEFVKDSSLWRAIQDSNLTELKKSIENCASLDMSLYDTNAHADQTVIMDLIWKTDADSMIYYLIENGMDSTARTLWYGFATEAMWAGDTNLVRYAIEKGYPINGETVYRAITKGMEGEFGSQVARKWYHELLPLIPDIDSVRYNVNGDYSILHEFCGQVSPNLIFLSEEDQLFYFQDLIDKGYSVNKKSGDMVELDCCKYGNSNQTDLQKKFTDILIKAGADTTLVKWTYSE
ncbi:MAG: hypothetical protein IJ734_00640 [Fibrobacter sp.]|nr:hypothetical protein [Fibrobacter sp.]